MTRGVFNWNFYDVEKFLKNNGFRLNHIEGSHHYYTKWNDGALRQVCIPFHGSKSLKPRTLKGIIVQSGIIKDEWLK